MLIPHELDFGRKLFAAGHAHTIATGNTIGTKLIGLFNPEVLDEEVRYGFPASPKGPWGTGEESILVNAIIFWIALNMPDLADLRFAPGAGTISGDSAIPVTWWKDSFYVASGSQSFYDAEIRPAWDRRSLQTIPNALAPTLLPLLPAPPPAPPAEPLPDFASLFRQLSAQIERFTPILTQAAADAAAIRGLRASLQQSTPDETAIKRPNESLPPKNPRKRR